LKTIFGPIDIDRIGYGGRGHQSIHPLDADLQLPERSFSYELQRRLVKAAIQGPFREANSRILDSTGLTIHNHSLEPLLIEAAADFDGFYKQRIADPSQPSASLLVVAVDCKGIPMVKPEPNPPPVRLAKEQKKNKKKMATEANKIPRTVHRLVVIEFSHHLLHGFSCRHTPLNQVPHALLVKLQQLPRRERTTEAR
jgi:hypothetical protein